MTEEPILARLARNLAAQGLALRGGFAVREGDLLPRLGTGRLARSVLLVGNVGGDMWPAFASAREALAAAGSTEPMDDWTRSVIDPIAVELGAGALYPSDGPPYYPFQRWAERAEPVFPSPLRIFIHPDHGLWHAYRAALLVAEDLSFARHEAVSSPCLSCSAQPCLSACPVSAFTPGGFDDMACARHVDGPAGIACRRFGCLARRACPVGEDRAYSPEQMEFHMAAFLAPRRGGA